MTAKEGILMTSDLSSHGQPLSEMFRQPASPAEWEAYALTREQVEHFREFGYVRGIRILSDAQCDRLVEELQQLVDPKSPGNELFYYYKTNESEDPAKTLFHALGAWRIATGFHDLWWAPAYRIAAYQLLGDTLQLFHDQLFCKPAGHGGVVAWHQDYSYWTWTKPMAHLTCWIGLDDATRDNGCLWYVPGSHRWGLLPITGLAGDMHAVREVLTAEQQAAFDGQVPIELKRGEAAFHHPLLMHGSYENRSPRPRRAAVLNAMRRGVVSNIASVNRVEDLARFPTVPQDEPMCGQFYPVLFDPDKELAAARSRIPTIAHD
jgi:ectoine hydroxylase-related dioxygenase (phytanoyl-CoA dioxygenase family)